MCYKHLVNKQKIVFECAFYNKKQKTNFLNRKEELIKDKRYRYLQPSYECYGNDQQTKTHRTYKSVSINKVKAAVQVIFENPNYINNDVFVLECEDWQTC